MKLKFDENNHVVVENGMPVYEYADGTEKPYDAPTTTQHIGNLNKESTGWRIKAQELEAKIAKYGDHTPQSIKELESGNNKDSDVDLAQFKADLERNFEDVKAGLEAQNKQKDMEINGLYLKTAFNRSEYLKKLKTPLPMVESHFMGNFSVVDQDGERMIVGQLDGHNIMSKTNPGNVANFDEAMEVIVNACPFKDDLFGARDNGSGSTNGSGGTRPELSRHDRTVIALKQAGFK